MRQRCYTARPLREEARHKAYVLFYFLLFIVSFLGGRGGYTRFGWIVNVEMLDIVRKCFIMSFIDLL